MFLQRPSSASSQDITHVLAKTFREFFTRDAVPPDTVKYLNTSKGGDDVYHEKYVESLRKIQEEREKRMAEAAMLETHIMQAQARAMSADERELNRVTNRMASFPDLGLPPSRSYFRSCIDNELLKKHNLITPEDFSSEDIPVVPPPSDPEIPNYARDTMSSAKRNEEEGKWESPFPSPRNSMAGDVPSLLSSDNEDAPLESKEGLKDLWKLQINAEEREYNRRDLANLQAKVEYLKNPRHIPPSAVGAPKVLNKPCKKKAKEIGIKIVPDKESPKEPSVVFEPIPAIVTFSEYKVGAVYELPLELKNISSVLRPVRVIPPKTQYFSISLGQFPGEQGLVAPGMSCRYMIRFSPDSLVDFDDSVTIQTQSSTSLVVKLQGRRPPPKLTIPSTINVGQCLIGGIKVGQFHLKNEGGPGKFCMMSKLAWPSNNLKSATALGTVIIVPFEVRPPFFELDRGQSIVLEVLFAPMEVKAYEAQLTCVCDNCHIRHFTLTGEGQSAGVELIDVQGGVSDPLPGELCDLTAQHLIRFENLNPFTYLQKSITVKNLTNVELPFDWIIVKPYIKPKDPESKDSPIPPTERVQDIETVFSIEPESSVLAPSTTTTFTLTFAPPHVQEFHDAFHLVLRNIPKVPPTIEMKRELSLQEMKHNESRPGSVRPQTVMPAREPMLEDITALEFEAKGVCETLSVVLQPYAITLPGLMMVETLVKTQFKMINNSLSAILFQWEHHSSSFILEVEPPIGELGPQCELDLELSVSGSEPCKIDHTLNCHVHHLDEPLMLHVKAQIKGPEVSIEEPEVNFGLVRLGDIVTRTVTVRNECRVPASWCIREAPSHIETQEDILPESEFSFSPECGELRPLETMAVTVTYKPKTCKTVRTVFEVQVEDTSESAILVRGEVQKPEVCLLKCELTLPDVYLDVPLVHQVSLLNQTLLPTSYQWGELKGKDADKCRVMVEPSNGSLEGREQLGINIHFTPHKVEELTDLILPCTIAGMDEDLYLSLYADVKGLSVSYRIEGQGDAKQSENSSEISIQDSEDLYLDFGDSVNVGEVVKRTLIITNHSAITAPFSLNVEYFVAKPPTPPGHRPDTTNRRRAILSRTPNLADPLSRAPSKKQTGLLDDYICKSMLKDGRGAAFTVSPASGQLQPFCDQVIEVTSLSDMWGDYMDRLICKVEGLDIVYIPMKVSIRGCPLFFQMVAAQPSQQPILRCGSHVSGVAPVMRQMRINNPSPVDIRVDWQIFNETDNDSQLLDFILAYNEDFPHLDEQGNELLPEEDEVVVYERPPTGYLPNSPDSTPAISCHDTSLTVSTPAPIADSRPKIIHITLREHGGMLANNPYTIKPIQTVIPARYHNTIQITFTPLASSDVNKEIDCNSFALGYMSLSDEIRRMEGAVVRPDGYSVAPLRLEMTAQVKPALLTIECADDEGMLYRTAASDLLHEQKLQERSLKLRSAILTNNTKTPLYFRMLTAEPFSIVQLDSDTRKAVAQMTSTDMTSLRPRENAVVQVGYELRADLLKYLNDDTDVNSGNVEIEVRDKERRIHFRQDLVIEFINSSRQVNL
ncbi:hypothetical protein LSH36_535g01010 [Paralvinella palmiformis]|uniref:Deleted in lung and esophageal cancer protein 1 n=1 Tax=Paralvinella palmiformis TaxID=53620 RepID=A0AAD9MXH5_9ANNE|nr:hypothetical protein LSH36_535g01010 [Paralvinella palmiformis]